LVGASSFFPIRLRHVSVCCADGFWSSCPEGASQFLVDAVRPRDGRSAPAFRSRIADCVSPSIRYVRFFKSSEPGFGGSRISEVSELPMKQDTSFFSTEEPTISCRTPILHIFKFPVHKYLWTHIPLKRGFSPHFFLAPHRRKKKLYWIVPSPLARETGPTADELHVL